MALDSVTEHYLRRKMHEVERKVGFREAKDAFTAGKEDPTIDPISTKLYEPQEVGEGVEGGEEGCTDE